MCVTSQVVETNFRFIAISLLSRILQGMGENYKSPYYLDEDNAASCDELDGNALHQSPSPLTSAMFHNFVLSTLHEISVDCFTVLLRRYSSLSIWESV